MHTCLEIGNDGAASEGSFGGVEGDRVGGARLQVGQLVLLLAAVHQESVSCHWKTEVRHTCFSAYNIYFILFPSILSKVPAI